MTNLATTRFARLRAGVAAMLLVTLALVGCSTNKVDTSAIPNYTKIPGGTMGPPPQKATETDGSSWAYASPAAGKITLLYFGYTSCPDVCPTTMADLAMAMSKLDPSVTDKVWVQFVSTDPNRDTNTQITAWLDSFDPSFHGARAPIDDVIAAADTYGIGIEKPTEIDGSYQVTHGGQLLVLNPQGQEVGFFQELAGSSSYITGIPILVDAYA